VVVQGGDQVCQVVCSSSYSILQLKVTVGVEAGIESATLSIYMPEFERPLGESFTLQDCGMPSKLYALKLHRVDIVALVAVRPNELTDAQLAEACLTEEGKAGDIISLNGCTMLSDLSCLAGLKQMQELDISGCTDTGAAKSLAKVIAVHP
jgi:hypothetical protein